VADEIVEMWNWTFEILWTMAIRSIIPLTVLSIGLGFIAAVVYWVRIR